MAGGTVFLGSATVVARLERLALLRVSRGRRRRDPSSWCRFCGARRKAAAGETPTKATETVALVRLRGQGDGAVEVRFCAVKNRAGSNRNCVAVMRGGEQRNENDQSVTQVVRVGNRRELDSVGVDGRVCDRKTKPAKRALGEEPNRRASGRSPDNTPMVGDGMAGSPLGRNQGDPPVLVGALGKESAHPAAGSQSVRSSEE